MKLEFFADRKTDNVALKFGIIGAGQCGGKITDLFASLKNNDGHRYYETMVVNSWEGDLKPLQYVARERRYLLKGGEGCGHKPKVCERLMDDPANQEMLMEAIEKGFKDADAFYVIAGLAGGTGTGLISSIIKLIDYIKNTPLLDSGLSPKPINAIVTMPRSIDTGLDKANAVDELNRLAGMFKEGILSSLVVIDNEKSFREYVEHTKLNPNDMSYQDWMDYSNQTVVQAIHEFNIGIMYPSDLNFDTQDLKNIFEDTPGIITISKTVFEQETINSGTLIDDIISCFNTGNVLADGHDLPKAKHAGYLIVRPRNINIPQSTFNELDIRLAQETPNALTRPGSCIVNPNRDDNRLIIYTINKIVQMPKRLREELEPEVKKLMESMTGTEDALAEIAVSTTSYANAFTRGVKRRVSSKIFERTDTQNSPQNQELATQRISRADIFKRN